MADRTPVITPATAVMPEAFAKDAIISWFRGEFAAANAIIDALCSHLSQFEGGRCEYEAVFAAIHRRRLNWIPILQMQKFFSISDVTTELQKVAENKVKVKIVDENVTSPVTETKREIVVQESVEIDVNGGCEVVDDDSVKDYSPKSGITDAGSQEVNSASESMEICSNQEDWEARRAEMKLTKGFAAKESVKGHMVNVVRGLKLYEDIFNTEELSKLTNYVTELRVAGQNGELSGETFIMYNQKSKAIKRELLQFGAPIFGQIKDDQAAATNKSQDSNIEPIPAPLEGVIDHLIQLHLISENRRPNSCIINFFDEGEFSQPFLKPPHLEQPISTLVLSESTMAFGRSLVCDNDGNYKGPLMLSLKQGSLLVMRGNSADMARHAMCQSPTKRISVTFFKVRIDKNTLSKDPMAGAMTVWQPSLPTGDLIHVLPKWGAVRAPQLLMLAPAPPMVMSPRRLPRGGTGVFLPWNNGSKKPTKHLPPRAQRGRLLALTAPTEPHKMGRTPGSGISVA